MLPLWGDIEMFQSKGPVDDVGFVSETDSWVEINHKDSHKHSRTLVHTLILMMNRIDRVYCDRESII